MDGGLRYLFVLNAALLSFASAPALSTSGRIECVLVLGGNLLKADYAEFIFDGTVVEEIRETLPRGTLVRSTLQVHRVWKGTVPSRFTVYGIGEIDGVPALRYGERYIAAASRLGVHRPSSPRAYDLPEDAVMALACAAIEYQWAGLRREVLKELGRGRAPSPQR